MEGASLYQCEVQCCRDVGDHVEYCVAVEHRSKLRWQVWRRFSEFSRLYEELASGFSADVVDRLPAPPRKSWLPSFVQTTEFLEQRQRDLKVYLQTMVSMPECVRHQALQELLGVAKPDEPAGIRVVPRGDDQFELEVRPGGDASASDSCAPVDEYSIEIVHLGSNSRPFKFKRDIGPTGCQPQRARIGRLLPGDHRFTVAAINTAGCSPPCAVTIRIGDAAPAASLGDAGTSTRASTASTLESSGVPVAAPAKWSRHPQQIQNQLCAALRPIQPGGQLPVDELPRAMRRSPNTEQQTHQRPSQEHHSRPRHEEQSLHQVHRSQSQCSSLDPSRISAAACPRIVSGPLGGACTGFREDAQAALVRISTGLAGHKFVGEGRLAAGSALHAPSRPTLPDASATSASSAPGRESAHTARREPTGSGLIKSATPPPGSGSIKSAKSGDSDDDDNYCVVCLSNEKTHAFVPCGHRCVCAKCSVEILKGTGKGLAECPVCRTRANGALQIFT